MTEHQLAKLLEKLPDAAMLPVGWLRAQLQQPETTDDGVGDLSCADVARELGRTPGCIRGWCARGEIADAYRLNKREWRIPRASLRGYLAKQAQRKDAAADVGTVNLGSWRK